MSDTAQREMTREELIAENATLRQERDALQSRIDKGMDYEHHTSCGHVWTIRHTACPECFTRAKADLALARAVLESVDESAAWVGDTVLLRAKAEPWRKWQRWRAQR